MTGAEGLKVAIRFRPLSDAERAQGAYEAFRRDPVNTNRVELDDRDARGAEPFVFNHVFTPDTTNEQVFTELVDLEPLLSGIHTTIFAYGVTGSGKTHTMLGDGGDEGIVQRTINALFREMARRPDRTYTMKLAVLEIYDKFVTDLLSGRSVGMNNCEVLLGEEEPKVATADEAIALICRGTAGRKTASTNKNEQSSRSHLVCRLTLESAGRGNATTRARLTLVDLAGSESAETAYGTVDEERRQREGKNINQSLLKLKMVFQELAEHRTPNFRGERLTELLRESLSGQGARMTMICAVSPARVWRDKDPTLSTLRLARTCSLIKIKAQANVVVDPKKRILELEEELRETRQKLSGLQVMLSNFETTRGAMAGGASAEQMQAFMKHMAANDQHRLEELQWQLTVQKSQKSAVVRDRDLFARLSTFLTNVLMQAGPGALASEAAGPEAGGGSSTSGGVQFAAEGSAAARGARLRRAMSAESLELYDSWRQGQLQPTPALNMPQQQQQDGAAGPAPTASPAPAALQDAVAAARGLPMVRGSTEGGAAQQAVRGVLMRAVEALRASDARDRQLREIVSLFEEMNQALEEYRYQQRDFDLEYRLNMVTADRNLLENSNAKLETEKAALISEVSSLRSEVASLKDLALNSARRAQHFEALSGDALSAAEALQSEAAALRAAVASERGSSGGGAPPSVSRLGSGLVSTAAATSTVRSNIAATVRAALANPHGSAIPSPSSTRRGTPRVTTANDSPTSTGSYAPFVAPATGGSVNTTPREGPALSIRTAGGNVLYSPAGSPSGASSGLPPQPPHMRNASAGNLPLMSGGYTGGSTSPRARAAALLSAEAAFTQTLQSKVTGSSPQITPRRRTDLISNMLRTGGSLIGSGASASAAAGAPQPLSRIPAPVAASPRSASNMGSARHSRLPSGGGVGGEGAAAETAAAVAGELDSPGRRGSDEELQLSSGPIVRPMWEVGDGGAVPEPAPQRATAM